MLHLLALRLQRVWPGRSDAAEGLRSDGAARRFLMTLAAAAAPARDARVAVSLGRRGGGPG